MSSKKTRGSIKRRQVKFSPEKLQEIRDAKRAANARKQASFLPGGAFTEPIDVTANEVEPDADHIES